MMSFAYTLDTPAGADLPDLIVDTRSAPTQIAYEQSKRQAVGLHTWRLTALEAQHAGVVPSAGFTSAEMARRGIPSPYQTRPIYYPSRSRALPAP